MQYVPISFKSDYSLLKSLFKIKNIIEYAESMNSEYVGLLDDNPYSLMDFMTKCTSAHMQGVFGMIVKIGKNKIYLYIKDYEGYKNLIKINNHVEDKNLNIEDIIKYNVGLICVLPYESYNLYNRFKMTMETFLAYKSEDELALASKISSKVVYLREITYFKKEDEPLLKMLYKIAGCEYTDAGSYVDAIREEDIHSIKEFVECIDLKFDFTKRYIPAFCKDSGESKKILYLLTHKGLEKRLNGHITEEYQRRLTYELKVISDMGFVDYFLIVYDYIKFAKKNDIYVGPGRGSAAGSLVSYSLGITEIDPIKYDLLFERFLNPERITMPDIDVDFEDTRRGEVIDYVKKRYGEDCVCLIIAYGTFGSRQALRDVAKIYGVEETIISSLSKLLDAKKTLKENAYDRSVSEFVKTNKLEKIYKISMRIEGLKKNTTIHAAGVIISGVALDSIIPTYHTSSGLLAGYTMEYLEKLGLLKMDFLALRNLSTIHNTVNIIKKSHPDFDIRRIPLDDKLTYDVVFKPANTDNVFQFETAGMRNFLKKLAPENYDDLVAAIALFRPGPMQNIDEYIARRKGLKKITYLHPVLESVLKPTYGIIIYQEQIMQILSIMAGYSYAEADLVRRAMSKKKKDVLANERDKFLRQAVARGYDELVASEVYELILRFADYGFNKSHSVAYALVAYQMAYLKANFSNSFQMNTLNMNIGSQKKIKDVIDEARAKGYSIVRPNINTSKNEYVIKGDKVILPLSSIKGVSEAQAKTIVDAQPYEDFFDFFKRTKGTNVNNTLVELLIKAGAFEDFCKSKRSLLMAIDAANTYTLLIESLDESLVMKPDLEVTSEPDEEYDDVDIFGFYVDGHPASKYTGKRIVKIKALKNYIGRHIELVVLVDKVKVINTKKGEKMAFVKVNDDTGESDSVVFPKNNEIIDAIQEGGLYRFSGMITLRDKEVQLVLERVLELEDKK